MTTTDAAVLTRIGAAAPYAGSRPLVVEELELDPPGPGEVLVRIGVAGVCHSDLSVVDGVRPRPVGRLLGMIGRPFIGITAVLAGPAGAINPPARPSACKRRPARPTLPP